MGKAMTAKQVSSYFIEKSSSTDENDLTNLKLQKILFYAQAEHLAAHGSPLFGDEIEAWQYGPLVNSVYDWLKGCGSYPITTFDVKTDASQIDSAQAKFLDEVWNRYGRYSAGYLVTKTHEPGQPWSQVYEKGRNNVIGNDLLGNAKLQNEW
jgi:uncharacterized phage-associated protein